METTEINIEFNYGATSTASFSFKVENDQLLATMPCKTGCGIDPMPHKAFLNLKDPQTFIMTLIKTWSKLLTYDSMNIDVTVVCEGQVFRNMYSQRYTLEDILLMRENPQTISRKDCCEYEDEPCQNCSYDWTDDLVYDWAARQLLTFHIEDLTKYLNVSKKLTLLKDKQCPVLIAPLDKNAIILKKCKHLISQEAWSKISWVKPDDGPGPSCKKCPLCRCTYSDSDYWTSDYTEMAALLCDMD
jgi:hypothetical protein